MISPLQCPSNLPLSSPFSCHISLLFSCSVMSDSATLWTAACPASPSFTISWSLLRLMSIKSVMPSKHLIFCRPLLLLPSIFSSIRVFSNESALVTWTIVNKLLFSSQTSSLETSALVAVFTMSASAACFQGPSSFTCLHLRLLY